MTEEPEESSDLLATYKKDGTQLTITQNNLNGKSNNVENTSSEPPDGGFRAYLVLIGSFLTNGLLFGVINSFGVIYVDLEKILVTEGVHNAGTRASLVGSLAMGTTFFLSPLSGTLTGFLGLRMTAVLGGSLATAGLLLSSFVYKNVDALCFTYGILYGMGASLAYTPSLAILGHYFKKYLGLVNGIVCIGSSVFTVIMPALIQHMNHQYGLEWMFRVLTVFTFGIALCGLLFKPIALTKIEKPLSEDRCFKTIVKKILTVEIWLNKKYRYWALSMPVALFGYFVPYIHMKAHIGEVFKNSDSNLPIQCLAVTSGVGRLLFGYLADKKWVNNIFLQQLSFYIIGTMTIILPFIGSFPLFVVAVLVMGLFDGAFIALIGPIAISLCGSQYAAQAIGCMLGMAAPPLSFGPPFAAYLHSVYNSYTIPFVLAGISPIVGATLMFIIRFQKTPKPSHPAANGRSASARNGDIERNLTLRESDPAPL
ncbi:monocarboxylate transporter 10 [Plutella xylostella]|uniref:monocarboxylate transporter 10 n=1 Tax=Plutella xylostella TaxID=51655 RepID=UPI0020321A9A|nr:monocarboxylate transporter 10 [Plutella xylostella]